MIHVQKGKQAFTLFWLGWIFLISPLLSRSVYANELAESQKITVAVPDVADDDDLDLAPASQNSGPALSALPSAASTAAQTAPPTLASPSNGVSPSLSWEIPPIPWRGSLTLTGGGVFPGAGDPFFSLSQQFYATGQSYVWQPWFLKLNGGMSVGRSENSSKTSSSTSSSTSFGGGGSLLPSTRYPFSFSGSVAKSDADSRSEAGGGVRSESQVTTIGLGQIYAPLDRAFSSTWAYNRLASEQSSLSAGEPLVQVSASQNIAVSVTVPIRTQDPQSLSFNTNVSTTKNQGAGSKSQVASLAAAHSIYLEDYVLTLSSNAAANLTDVTTVSQRVRSSFTNLTTNLDWIPSDDYPISIGGSAGYFNNKTGDGPSLFEVNTFNLLGNIRYPVNKNWNLLGQAGIVQANTQALGQQIENSSVSIITSAGWSADGVQAKLQAWDYSLSYGASAVLSYAAAGSSEGGSTAEGEVGGAVNVSQGLVRKYEYSKGAPILLTLSQGYGASVTSSGAAPNQFINHSAALGWASPSTVKVRKQLNASVSDGRSIGGGGQYFQQATGNALFQMETGPYSTVSGVAALNYSLQGGEANARGVIGASAGTRYFHARFANISGLAYDARYDLIMRESTGDATDSSNPFGAFAFEHSVAQGWSWRFGLLGWRIDYTISKSGDQPINQAVFVSIVRDFSGVL